MSWLVGIKDIVVELKRIADALERVSPPGVVGEKLKKKPHPGVIQYGNEEDRWVREQLRNSVADRGLSPEAETRSVEGMFRRYKRQEITLNEDL